jgi:hypothetical protein
MPNTTPERRLRDASMRTLLEETLESARDLATDEARMILAEASDEGARAKRIGAYLGAAVSIGTAGLSWIGMAILVAAHAAWWATLLVGLGALGVAAALALAAQRLVPEITFAQTRARLESRARRLVAAASDEPTIATSENRDPES